MPEREPLCALLRWLVWHRDDGRCHYCGTSDKIAEIDHVQPWSLGGPDTATNLRVLCRPCNRRRGTAPNTGRERYLPVTPWCDDCVHDNHRSQALIDALPPYAGLKLFEHRCPTCEPARSATDTFPGDTPVLAFCGLCRQITNVTNPGRLL